VTIGRDSTAEEIKELLQAFFGHPDYEAGMEEIWDFRNTSLAKTSAEELREMVEFLSQADDRRGIRIALALQSMWIWCLANVRGLRRCGRAPDPPFLSVVRRSHAMVAPRVNARTK
jgi:hypothetical protein